MTDWFDIADDDAPPLSGVTVVDAATLFAGPFAAAMLADFGAEVIKVEHPDGDPLRRYGPAHGDVPVAWKVINRNKKGVALDLRRSEGRDAFLRLAERADVLIENFRPGTLERWGAGPDVLTARNPRLVLVRVTAFGQDGPYAGRPGFGTLAEAMSGVAALSGYADGPPLLPAFPLGDAVAGLHATVAALLGLRSRDRRGRGQIADVAITEAMMGLLGFHIAACAATGAAPRRQGSQSSGSAPRNVYRCADGDWVAVSASARSVAERIMRLVGRVDLVCEPWFATGRGRAAHREVVDEAVAGWIAVRSRAEVIAAFEEAQAAIAPVYGLPDLLEDPHFAARGAFVEVADAELGTVRMPAVPIRLSATPGRIRTTGPALGEHAAQVLAAVEPRTAS